MTCAAAAARICVASRGGVGPLPAPSEICGVCTYLERWSPSLKTLGCSTSALLGAQPGSDGLGPATEPMLAEKPIQMGPHGSMRKAEPRRHFLVGKARRDEREHLRLPRSHPQAAEGRLELAIPGRGAGGERGENVFVVGGEGVGAERR